MTAVSKVSRRLTQAIAPEVVEHIYKPRLGAELQIVFPYLSALNQAHLVMLARQGIVKPETARGIAEALLRIEADGPSAITPDPLLEDAYFNVEARLIALTSADIGGRLHIARSRNDLSAPPSRSHSGFISAEWPPRSRATWAGSTMPGRGLTCRRWALPRWRPRASLLIGHSWPTS